MCLRTLPLIKPSLEKAKPWLRLTQPITEQYITSLSCQNTWNNRIQEVFQSNFRAHHSVDTTLVKVVNDQIIASDNWCVSILVLLDLTAVFNTIDHCMLLQKVEYQVGTKGHALVWLMSYHSDRHHFVHVRHEPSSHTKVNLGVPQGSVLGPLILSLYVLL